MVTWTCWNGQGWKLVQVADGCDNGGDSQSTAQSTAIPDSSEQSCMILRNNACLAVPGMIQTYCTITATEGTAIQAIHDNTERFANRSFESSRKHSKADCKNARHTRYIV